MQNTSPAALHLAAILFSRAAKQAALREALAYSLPNIGQGDDDKTILSILRGGGDPLPEWIALGWAEVAARDAGYEAANDLVGCGIDALPWWEEGKDGPKEVQAFQRRVAARFAEVMIDEARRAGLIPVPAAQEVAA